MKHTIRRKRTAPQPPLKVTALLYLQDALLKERYETCREIIRQAGTLGVSDFEIQDVLEDPKRDVIDSS